MSNSDLARRILQHVGHPNYRPVKPRVIAKQLKVPKEDHALLKREIKRLVKEGKISFGANHLVVGPTGSSSGATDELIGTFRRAMAGYGFVRPQGTSRSAGRQDDIFIPASRTKDAANGDLVRIRFRKRQGKGRDGRVSGEILQILERATKQFVGTYSERDGNGLVQVDGTEFPYSVFVGDPGAKGAQPGDKVVLEMVTYPTSNRPGEGVITEVLGAHGAPGVDTLTVIREFGLPDAFAEEVLQSAREEAQRFDASIGEDRRDLTELVVVTIDPVDARDFDDAISLERLENGHYRLGVHIADVSHFVRPKTPLDREARERATSVYLPDRVIPMLPEVISNHLASLQPNQVRYVKSAFIEYTAEGIRVATDFCTGAIRSRRRFAYEEVDEFLQDRIAWRIKLGPEIYQLLDDMHRLAMILRERRLARGSIELNLPEVKIELDREGRVSGAKRVARTESHQVIEEFMLAANEAVAERLSDDEILFLRRVHDAPDPTKIETLTEFVRELGIECESLESRFEVKRVLHAVEGEPIEPAINYAVLRSMQKAVYSPTVAGHFALASHHYCHFTSPIRRYPDLTIHRLMDSVFRGQSTESNLDHLTNLGDHCSQREQRAEAAERELIKLKLLHYLSDKIGQSLDVVVTGVEEFGLFAQGIQLPAEGLIHVQDLPDDHYHYDAQTHGLVGHRAENTFRLGDLLRVEIVQVDLQRRELDFVIRERLSPDAVLHDPFKGTAKKQRNAKKATAKKSASGKKQGKRPAAAEKATSKKKPKTPRKKRGK
jgi:ribonuclease R